MDSLKSIKMDGAGFSLAYIHSFENEGGFIAATSDIFYPWKTEKERIKLLKTVYRMAKKIKVQTP